MKFNLFVNDLIYLIVQKLCDMVIYNITAQLRYSL